MSFAAGMGAGIGCGLAIGMSSGKKQACQQIRNHVETNAISIHDATGAEVDVETFISSALRDRSLEQPGKRIALVILVLLGAATLGVLLFMLFR